MPLSTSVKLYLYRLPGSTCLPVRSPAGIRRIPSPFIPNHEAARCLVYVPSQARQTFSTLLLCNRPSSLYIWTLIFLAMPTCDQIPLTFESNDVFIVHVYSTFSKTFAPDATMELSVCCGSYRKEYGVPPDRRSMSA
jgi:hypothetical protein